MTSQCECLLREGRKKQPKGGGTLGCRSLAEQFYCHRDKFLRNPIFQKDLPVFIRGLITKEVVIHILRPSLKRHSRYKDREGVCGSVTRYTAARTAV